MSTPFKNVEEAGRAFADAMGRHRGTEPLLEAISRMGNQLDEALAKVPAPKPTPEPPSKLFMDLCTSEAGTTVASCGHCGRNELRRLQEQASLQPTRYIEDAQNDSIGVGNFAGKQTVWNCPCNWLRPYEDFIINNRDTIIEFLHKRAADQLDDAQLEVAKLKGL